GIRDKLVTGVQTCALPILAAFVEESATNCCRLMRPLLTPSENNSGRRVSTPGTPLGILRKLCAAPGSFLPRTSSYLKAAWSDDRTWKVLAASPVQICSWFSVPRGGGERTHLLPSSPGFPKCSS